MKRSKISHKLAAIATMGMMAASSTDAFATNNNFRTITQNIVAASSGFNNLISTVCWIGGAGLGVAGIFKLKQHVDNPGQTPMKDGLVRLGCGGGLLCFPFIETAMQGSISNSSGANLSVGTVKIDNVSTLS